MAGPRAVQSVGPWAAAAVASWLAVSVACVVLAVHDPEPDLRHPAVTISARYSVWAWFAACGMMLVLRPGEWREFGSRARFARLLWTLGLAMHVVHVLFAFGLSHRWSHAAAVEHVAAAGGFGWAIAVNYLFAAVWLADVLWWWADPTGYANRPRWVGRAVHGLLAFVVFNAAVVFGPAGWRVVDAVLFGVLAVLWWRRTR